METKTKMLGYKRAVVYNPKCDEIRRRRKEIAEKEKKKSKRHEPLRHEAVSGKHDTREKKYVYTVIQNTSHFDVAWGMCCTTCFVFCLGLKCT